jgi:Holliday junction resolvasome RuvABC endonuclease subunit
VKNLVIGVNPASDGNKGGIAVVTVDYQPRLHYSLEIVLEDNGHSASEHLASATWDTLTIENTCTIAIEDQYHGKNAQSTIKLARGAGRWIEAARNFNRDGLPYKLVNPKTWQSQELTNCGKLRHQLKIASCNRVKALYGVETRHYLADAILIARYYAITKKMEEITNEKI